MTLSRRIPHGGVFIVGYFFGSGSIHQGMCFRAFIGAVLFLVFLVPVDAYGVHKGAGSLVCGNCHTMHNSQGNTALEGLSGGSIVLLRGGVSSRAEIHKLCLQCHGVGGSMATVNHLPHGERAPIVYGGNQLNWDQTKDFSQIGAGGDFFKELDSNFDLTTAGSQTGLGYGHSVGLTTTIPGNPNSVFLILTCTSCHNHHGTNTQYDFQTIPHATETNIYRNLWGTIGGVQVDGGSVCSVCHYMSSPVDEQGNARLFEMKSYIGGITGQYPTGYYTPEIVNGVAIWPVYKGTPTVPSNNTVYDGIRGPNDHSTRPSGMGGWCARCHIYFHEVRVNENISGEDWRRHPVDAVINDSDVSGAGVDTIDWAHYDSIPDGYKLPVANTDPNLNQEVYYADTNNEDKVFCLSCHFAHGGPYYDALRWDYTSTIGVGQQTGIGLSSTTGCQICHNR